MNLNAKTLLAAAAFTGLLTGQSLLASNPGQAADGTSSPRMEEKKNSCSGKSGCEGKEKKDEKKTDKDKNSCSGKSGCEGKDKKS